MLAHIIRFSIRYSGLVILLAILLLFYGSYRFSNAGLDIFPEFSPKQVVIQTEAPSYSPEQVEILISKVIETSLGGVIGLTSTRSESIQGLSIVTANFEEQSEVYQNRQRVSERLSNLAEQMPPGVHAPMAVPLSSSSATVLTLGLSTQGQLNLMGLRSLVDGTLVPRLLSVPGVADVNVFGGEIQQLQIQLDPEKLQRFQLTPNDVVKAARQAGTVFGSGFIENQNQRFNLQITGAPENALDFSQITIKQIEGLNISLDDISTIKYAAEPAIGAAQIMGQPGIVLMVIGQYGANTLSVSKDLEQVLNDFSILFEDKNIHFYSHLFKPADYIERSISNLSSHLILGSLFVIIILFIFLFDIKTAVISATAIPLSLVSAVVILVECSVNLNIMVLGGLAIALGEVVDDAIIDTENIFRRLKENAHLQTGKTKAEIIFDASMEVRSSVVYASFIVALAFIPLLTLPGIAGRLFSPLSYSYILAILMSLLVALTLTPALAFRLLNGQQFINKPAPPVIKAIQPIYRYLLTWINKHFVGIVIICLSLCIVGYFVLSQQKHKFLPELREGHYILHTSSIPGTSLDESIRLGSQITKKLLEISGIESISQWAGRAERGADTYGSHYSEYEVRLEKRSGNEQQAIFDQITDILDVFPGIIYEANSFLIERIDETITGYTSPLVVNIFGHDLTALDNKAHEVAEIIRSVNGAKNIQIRSIPATPYLEINILIDRLHVWGVNPEQIYQAIQIVYEGEKVSQIEKNSQIIEVVVTLNKQLKQNFEQFKKIQIRTNKDILLPITELVEIKHVHGRYNILHQNAQRIQTITADVDDRDFNEFLAEVKEKILSEIKFETNSYPEFTGSAIEQAHSKHELILHSLFAGIGIIIFIYIAIGNFKNTLLTLINLPFAMIGGIAAVTITDGILSVGSVVGFVTLFGITIRNSIMLVSHYQYLTMKEGKPWNVETMIIGAQERLPSILMTALVTSLAMLPIAFDSDNPGMEIMGPMAAIIIGGLASSTLLNLLLLPSILIRFARFDGSSQNQVNY